MNSPSQPVRERRWPVRSSRECTCVRAARVACYRPSSHERSIRTRRPMEVQSSGAAGGVDGGRADSDIEALDLAVPRSKRVSRNQTPAAYMWEFFGSPFVKLTLGDAVGREAATGDPGQQVKKKKSTPSSSCAEKGPVQESSPRAVRLLSRKPCPSPRTKRLPVQEPLMSSSAQSTLQDTDASAERRPFGRRPVGIIVDDAPTEDADDPGKQAVVPAQQPFGRKMLWRRSKKFAKNCVSRAARKIGLGSSRAE